MRTRPGGIPHPAGLAAGLAVELLAGYRLTRAVVEDSHDMPLLVPLRTAAERALAGSAWADAINCGWCSSLWVGLGIVAARRVAPRVWRLAAGALAVSAASGLLRQAEVALARHTELAEARLGAEAGS